MKKIQIADGDKILVLNIQDNQVSDFIFAILDGNNQSISISRLPEAVLLPRENHEVAGHLFSFSGCYGNPSKIHAIKLLRDITGWDFVQAKKFIEYFDEPCALPQTFRSLPSYNDMTTLSTVLRFSDLGYDVNHATFCPCPPEY